MKPSVPVPVNAVASATEPIAKAVAGRGAREEQNESAAAFLLPHLLDHMQESVVITNAEGNIIQVNAAFTEITGYSAAEAIGQSARFMQTDHHDELFHQQMWQQIYDTGHWYGQIWNRRKTGEVYLQRLNISSVRNEHGHLTHMIGLGQDLTVQQASQSSPSFVGLEDPLTRLGNRHLLTIRLDEAIAHAKSEGTSIALFVLDIGRLRVINDELGMAWGDAILRRQAKRLTAAVASSDTLVRLQGDLFAIIRHSRGHALSIAQFANQLLTLLTTPDSKHSKAAPYLQPSIGIALYPRDALENTSLLHAAEYAHVIAKSQGRHRFQFIDLYQHEVYHRALLIERTLDAVLSQSEGTGLSVHYQPQVCPKDGHICSLEALLRWQHPTLGYLSPAEFIPIAEQTGQSVALERWVICAVYQQLAHWQHVLSPLPCISINIGALQLLQTDFADWLQLCGARAAIKAANIQLEITENTLMEPRCAPMLDKLRRLGFKVSLDDFGTGYSALAHLHRFSFDELKVDRNFILEASDNNRAFILLSTIAQLAHQLELSLVIEGVETSAQLALLAELGPLKVQGFYYYPPLPPHELEAVLTVASFNK